jgi:hypothetical protein
MVTAAASYVLLFALLLWQALRAQSVIAPDGVTLAALGGWAIVTTGAVWIAARPRPSRQPSRAVAY